MQEDGGVKKRARTNVREDLQHALSAYARHMETANKKEWTVPALKVTTQRFDLEVLIRVQKTSLRKEGDFNVATVAYGAASAQLHALFQALDISGDGSIDAKDFPDQGTASCAELVQLMQYCDGAVDGARDGAIDQREFFAGFVALAMNGVNNIGLMPAAQPGGAVSAATQAAAVLAASAGLSAGVSFAGSIHDAVKHVEAVMQQALATHASSLHAVANQQVAIKATAGAASAPYPFPLETSGVKTHFPIVLPAVVMNQISKTFAKFDKDGSGCVNMGDFSREQIPLFLKLLAVFKDGGAAAAAAAAGAGAGARAGTAAYAQSISWDNFKDGFANHVMGTTSITIPAGITVKAACSLIAEAATVSAVHFNQLVRIELTMAGSQ